ncbi:MAG: TIR domain-containing protein, partial [Clostridia bacterium]|nr:TIR domain-containing protein [Clostridia bacterium]
MAILKCKMCGGDILLSEDKTTGTCDHCGSTMTFPRVSDEQKLNLYNRANHFRRQNEFDKAIAAYDKILDQDDTDAEAHWGAVLSRYGIEYVEDPASHERIPTCHRVQAASILSDPDYLSALEYAPDTVSRTLYEQEARRIAEIQKGILAISSQEKPYDVFICYKETDEAGRRTRDSALAQDIYYQLTNEGYKVFFSRITLEDKLGTEYEPYIFAALNSAKVMLVVGTKPEYFNAVWVKNEWSRYLALMKNDRSRLLIPCYRDMDPYDLPEELSALQSQDMSKIGFVQDLIRGVKKVLDSKKPAEPKPTAPQVTATGANIENLMKRAYLFMEDGDFKSANEYLD